MKTRLCLAAAALLTALCLSAAAPAPDWETLARQGDAAYGRGDYAGAADLYEQAADRTTDPRRMTFNLAAARYRQALGADADRARLAQEAEQAYRCCTQADDPRRAQALYGLGDALLLKADGRDADALKEAVAAYGECLSEENLDGALADAARHNRERARLLLMQIPPSSAHPKEDQPPGDGTPKPPSPPDHTPGSKQKPGRDPSQGGKPDPNGRPINADQGGKPIETAEPPPPGSGHLPPVPDRADLPPLSAEDAAQHLDLAAQRILLDFKAHRRTKAPAPPSNVRDW
jgi:hypothetical protein